MKLIATPRSHFSRKVRLLLDHLELAYSIEDVGNVADADLDLFRGNPNLSVPMLIDEGRSIFDSDHIAAYIARKFDPDDRFDVLTSDPVQLNIHVVMNTVMANEVKLILAQRTGLDPAPHAFFQKAATVIEGALLWLEEHVDAFDGDKPTYTQFHFQSLWDHLVLFGPELPQVPRLEALSQRLGAQPLFARSRPPA